MDEARSFRFLDTQEDRAQLVEDIRRVRRAVIQIVDQVPEAKWYEPRYHGWSLAAMLGHLQFIDRVYLTTIQLALVGVRPPLPMALIDRANNIMASVYRQRVIGTTLKGIARTETRIADFIETLPMDKFTVSVYYPPRASYITVEQALQVFFLFHWQDHLTTMRAVEGISYEPPGGRDALV